MKQQIKGGIVETISNKEISFEFVTIHHLPQRTVVRETRINTKARIVFDASAHLDNESSSNDVLYSGTCMLPLLFGIFIRFKIVEIGIVTDITQAFLQIEINEQHCNFHRIN